ARLTKWVEAKSAELQEAWPAMPEGLTDRPADCWEPLLAVADVAGGEWPDRARRAALKLNDQRQQADPSLGTRLLADIRSILEPKPDSKDAPPLPVVDRIKTALLLDTLTALEESPWGDLRGKSLDSRGLARRLGAFDNGAGEKIRPKELRIDGA